jgi:glycosyltransferase involved in cell wall biosynthesis
VEGTVAVSVIVCTYNRCEKLARSLDAIAAAAIESEMPVELIVVDNNSHDATEAVVDAFARVSPIPVRRVAEPRQGLSYARNRGIVEARGEIIAFTDDDCIVDPDWIAAVAKEFEAAPEVMIVGGRVDLHTPEDKPVTIRPLGERVRYASADQIYGHIIGCNMTLRRRLVERIGWFDPALGDRYGVTADDIDFTYRALRAGAGVVFTPDARVRHDHGRRTDAEVTRLQRSYLRGRGAFYLKHAWRDRRILKHLYWELRNVARPLGHLSVLASGALHVVLKHLRLRGPL